LLLAENKTADIDYPAFKFTVISLKHFTLKIANLFV